MNKNKGNAVRVIAAISDPYTVLKELHSLDNNYNIVCLIPEYRDFINQDKIVVDVNKMLSYFRSKLLIGELPSIISNSCAAGFIYNMLGMRSMGALVVKSPTINTYIEPSDFIKLCKDPEKYLSQVVEPSHFEIHYGRRCPVGIIEDISVVFVHDADMKSAVRHWNVCRKLVDHENLAFVMEDCGKEAIDDLIAQEYCKLHIKHLLVLRNRTYSDCNGAITVNHNHFHERGMAVEEWFDLLDWVNSVI